MSTSKLIKKIRKIIKAFEPLIGVIISLITLTLTFFYPEIIIPIILISIGFMFSAVTYFMFKEGLIKYYNDKD